MFSGNRKHIRFNFDSGSASDQNEEKERKDIEIVQEKRVNNNKTPVWWSKKNPGVERKNRWSKKNRGVERKNWWSKKNPGVERKNNITESFVRPEGSKFLNLEEGKSNNDLPGEIVSVIQSDEKGVEEEKKEKKTMSVKEVGLVPDMFSWDQDYCTLYISCKVELTDYAFIRSLHQDIKHVYRPQWAKRGDYCLVFHSPEMAAEAVSELEEVQVHGYPLQVDFLYNVQGRPVKKSRTNEGYKKSEKNPLSVAVAEEEADNGGSDLDEGPSFVIDTDIMRELGMDINGLTVNGCEQNTKSQSVHLVEIENEKKNPKRKNPSQFEGNEKDQKENKKIKMDEESGEVPKNTPSVPENCGKDQKKKKNKKMKMGEVSSEVPENAPNVTENVSKELKKKNKKMKAEEESSEVPKNTLNVEENDSKEPKKKKKMMKMEEESSEEPKNAPNVEENCSKEPKKKKMMMKMEEQNSEEPKNAPNVEENGSKEPKKKKKMMKMEEESSEEPKNASNVEENGSKEPKKKKKMMKIEEESSEVLGNAPNVTENVGKEQGKKLGKGIKKKKLQKNPWLVKEFE